MNKTFLFAAAAVASLTVNVYAADKNGNKIPNADGTFTPIDPSLLTMSLSNAKGETAVLTGNSIMQGDSVDGASFEVDYALVSDPAVKGSSDVVLTGVQASLVAEVVAVPVEPSTPAAP